MYWEQLELRCRSLYSGPPMPPPGPAIIGTPRGGPCRCCEQCHAHRSAMPSAYPWDSDSRFWAPGQSGNFYSPNPGGDEGNRLGVNGSNQRNRTSGWNWPRMPWQRNEVQQNQAPQDQQPQQRFRQTPSSPDAQYGFANGGNGATVSDSAGVSSQQGGYSVIGNPNPYGIWGPPPPYSDPNSPARRGRYQYIHPSQCHQPIIEHIPPTQQNLSVLECHQHQSSTDSQSLEQFCPQQSGQLQTQNQQQRNATKRQTQFKSKDNYENTPSDSDGGSRDRFSNTLPVRKTKKRVEIGANKSIGPNQPQQRINVQNVFNNLQNSPIHQTEVSENEYNEPTSPSTDQSSKSNNTPQHAKNRRIKLGIENTGFQPIEANERDMVNGKLMEPTESEVYFADVSSCCNISVKNDNYYEDANQRRNAKNEKIDEDDYLSQRFGKRENSVRSRLPFPQMVEEEYEKSPKSKMNIPVVPAPRTSLIPKDLSRQSMCSIDSGEKTDFTDLSPATPCANFQPIPMYQKQLDNYPQENFVASFPYNEQSQEAHRRSTKNIQDIFLAPDAQYETIKDSNQYETTPLTLNYEHHHELSSSSNSSSSGYSNSHQNTPASPANQPKSPKNINVNANATPIKRQNLGNNISAIIQNLSGNNDFLCPDNGNTNNNSTTTSSLSANLNNLQQTQQDCNNIINNNISNTSSSNILSEKQKEWSDLNNDRRL